MSEKRFVGSGKQSGVGLRSMRSASTDVGLVDLSSPRQRCSFPARTGSGTKINLHEYPRRFLEAHCVHYLTDEERLEKEVEVKEGSLR